MCKYYLFCAVLLTTLVSQLQAQTRYLDPIFSEVGEAVTVEYAQNVNIIAQGAVTPLTMDVYAPVGDTVTQRPVVVIWHTGNFLPQYFNGSAYGSKTDSVNIEIINRLVTRGYVAIAATYRAGWQPTATDQAVRTGSLLQAVYRASQDAHALARFLRKSVAEEDNPYGIDPERITYLGIGSGGYVALAHNFLDNVTEIEQNAQFYDPMGNLLVDTTVLSDPEGLQPASQHVVNHPGYSSDVAFTFNLGGALGDTLWMNGIGQEAPVASVHSFTDALAPFNAGTVVVPTIPPMPVVDVQGSNLVLRRANETGINDVLEPANEATLPTIFDPLSSVLNQITAARSGALVTSPIPTNTQDTFPLGVNNLWTIVRLPPNAPTGTTGTTTGIWNWTNETILRGTVAAINMQVPDADLSADDIIDNELATNPNTFDAAKARENIDTIMAYFYPRAWYAMDLDNLVSTEDLLDAQSVGLSVVPNPANEYFELTTDEAHPIRQISIFDINGRNVATLTGVNQSRFRVDRGDLPRGTYIVQIRLDDGMVTRKIVLR
ncbi:T9SS type A sorting domain-containing protein [Lewinella sp. W8]|uniref:T9SS type A sorting domain-containing protein n=1 Tax=Lewinella sp. W8 TaxID=2528208 RepID=UPI001067D1C8|nr:T9SS type A sorting domain-containing protein [Lewinella sp. W8]MTB49487.1 T9SS type A sorting domain-containing protein [Lewinella sp. W8]